MMAPRCGTRAHRPRIAYLAAAQATEIKSIFYARVMTTCAHRGAHRTANVASVGDATTTEPCVPRSLALGETTGKILQAPQALTDEERAPFLEIGATAAGTSAASFEDQVGTTSSTQGPIIPNYGLPHDRINHRCPQQSISCVEQRAAELAREICVAAASTGYQQNVLSMELLPESLAWIVRSWKYEP